jgi:hypothetical protein
MPGEREPERQSSVVTDIVRATEQGGEVRRSYIRIMTEHPVRNMDLSKKLLLGGMAFVSPAF